MGRSAPASRNAKVCEDHFEAKEFKTDLVNGRRKLKANAVPSLLLNAEWNLPTTEKRAPAAKPPCDAPQAETVELHESGLNREKKPELTPYLEQKKCWKTEEERGKVRQSTSHTFTADQIRTSEKGTIEGSSSRNATVPNALSTETVCGSKGCEYVKENMVPLPAPRTLHKQVECTEDFPSDGGACSKDVGCLPGPTTDILFKCCFCTHITRDQRGILDHLVVHNCEQQLKCQHCPEHFSKGENLGCHTEIHKPERTFECQLCPAEFRKNSDLVTRWRWSDASERKLLGAVYHHSVSPATRIIRHSAVYCFGKVKTSRFLSGSLSSWLEETPQRWSKAPPASQRNLLGDVCREVSPPALHS
ncbi:histone-lysine N-methyltransferase PRDM9-like [Ixodes scapularis]